MTETAFQAHTLVRHELKRRQVEVARIIDLTPHMKRVTVTGPELAGFQTLGASDHIKLAFPPEGDGEEQRRDYTPRRFDESTLELDLDFVLHGDGVATRWLKTATPGSQVHVLGPRGSHVLSTEFDWYLLAGDETSIPSIARQIELLGDNANVTAFIEVTDETDDLAIPNVTWLHRGTAKPGTTTLLQDAIRAFGKPEGRGFVSASGEATSLVPIRRYLLREAGFNPDFVDVSGHWKRNVADWDHHEAIGE